MIRYTPLLLLFLNFSINDVFSQSTLDSIQYNKEYSDLDEALKNPEIVFRIDLSNQDLQISDSIWSKFTNLRYLSLKDDHLKQIPTGIGNLKNLEVLDLSGNDFKELPSNFSNLTNLKELYLNDDKFFRIKSNIPVLSKMSNLRFLHLENNGLKSLPEDIYRLSHLEKFFINNNNFKKFPVELTGLKKLQYLDFHENEIKLPQQDIHDQNFGFEIRF